MEADEVTYTMHVILRYEIEKGLINGDITVDEVPALWNKKMAEYLGDDNVPPTDAQGCLQDVHWGGGAFGYFPTYSLGAMYVRSEFSCLCVPFQIWTYVCMYVCLLSVFLSFLNM